MHDVSSASALVTRSVREMYEAFPYPRYPLLTPLKWRDGYSCRPEFSWSLASSHSTQFIQVINPRILIAGCGDTQPYIFAKWASRGTLIDAVDLSSANIRRARVRTFFCATRPRYFPMDLGYFLETKRAAYHHIDCYGVLHHLANPSEILSKLAANLTEGGTMRVMVYNSVARGFIHHIQRGFHMLGLDYRIREDLSAARAVLSFLGQESTEFARILNRMQATLNHASLLVDTFFHAREARIGFSHWLDMFECAGLSPIGILDRYGELDHLPNPLRHFPEASTIERLIESGSFIGNFEIFLVKNPAAPGLTAKMGHKTALLGTPPRLWFSFSETENLNPIKKLQLWQQFLNPKFLSSVELAKAARLRLARLGAIVNPQDEDDTPMSRENAPNTDNSPPNAKRFEDRIKSYLQARHPTRDSVRISLAAQRFNRALLNCNFD